MATFKFAGDPEEPDWYERKQTRAPTPTQQAQPDYGYYRPETEKTGDFFSPTGPVGSVINPWMMDFLSPTGSVGSKVNPFMSRVASEKGPVFGPVQSWMRGTTPLGNWRGSGMGYRSPAGGQFELPPFMQDIREGIDTRRQQSAYEKRLEELRQITADWKAKGKWGSDYDVKNMDWAQYEYFRPQQLPDEPPPSDGWGGYGGYGGYGGGGGYGSGAYTTPWYDTLVNWRI